MISVDYDLTVRGFTKKELPYGTLVRAHSGQFEFALANDGGADIRKLSVRAVMESYVGREKPLLFQWADTQVINEIGPKDKVKVEFKFWPFFPGLVSVALYVSDAASKPIKVKRQTESSYGEGPVRWWFHVADDTAVETLRELRKLVAIEKEAKE